MELADVAAIVVAELGWVDDLVLVSVDNAVELTDVVAVVITELGPEDTHFNLLRYLPMWLKWMYPLKWAIWFRFM